MACTRSSVPVLSAVFVGAGNFCSLEKSPSWCARSLTQIPRQRRSQPAPLVAGLGGEEAPASGDHFYINKPRISWSCHSLAKEKKETIQNQRWVKEKICPIRGGSPDNQSDAKTCDRPRGNSKTTKPTACGVCQGARCSCLKISSAALASASPACRRKGREGKTGEGCGSRGGGTAANNIFAIWILPAPDYSFAVCHRVTGEQNKTGKGKTGKAL